MNDLFVCEGFISRVPKLILFLTLYGLRLISFLVAGFPGEIKLDCTLRGIIFSLTFFLYKLKFN